ncbi:MAG TPA: iron-sulfur cluster biosynthesis family protein [Thermoanaerobaculia bacterium]|nr:iron-sulfur cluster biosynthesis family protein [Thermoanaerobaculia bacterium]
MNLSLSADAAEHLEGKALRIAFTTGCGGSGYRLSYSEPIDGDTVFEVDDIRVALDSMAATRLDGVVIEYDPVEDGFVLQHPDAVSAVWCG